MEMTTAKQNKIPGSFRDPSGFLFYQENILYRQINLSYQDDYELLMNSGLYQRLVKEKLLVEHQEISLENITDPKKYKIIRPDHLDFISYPYEWGFNQLKQAALLTLKIQKIALESGLTLKDASAYNVQFNGALPIFIDTLSFSKYNEGEPWIAYRQYCQHFLAPLALMAYRDIRLNQLFRVFIDGIPLDLASRLLPLKTKLKFSLLSHIHLHAKSQKLYANKTIEVAKQRQKISKFSFLGLIDNLEEATKSLNWKIPKTEWGDYYQDDSYSQEALKDKKELTLEYLEIAQPKNAWDLGGNTGLLSRLASDQGIKTICFDIDQAAVEKNYLYSLKKDEKNLIPLFLDLTNPSPGLGWNNNERQSLVKRGPVDIAFAFALVHHLAISNNLPFSKIAQFCAQICNWLIIEFVPKQDKKVKKLLATREDIFPNYNQDNFEKVLAKYFEIIKTNQIKNSLRVLYLMKKKNNEI